MFHNRIASSLRDHFSTVGPSPTKTSAPSSPEPSSSSSRLMLVPASAASPPLEPRARDRRGFITDLVTISSHRVAAFLAEAAVLVLVLGILDRFLASNRLELHWVGGAFLISTLLLTASIVLELSARRWLSRA